MKWENNRLLYKQSNLMVKKYCEIILSSKIIAPLKYRTVEIRWGIDIVWVKNFFTLIAPLIKLRYSSDLVKLRLYEIG